jgi:hypothetical protein
MEVDGSSPRFCSQTPGKLYRRSPTVLAWRPWICSSVTTLTGASASTARSSVFEAATVMVSSDCTGARPICAYAFKTGAGAACTFCGFGLRLDCFCRSCEPPAPTASAVCAKPESEKPNANENIDAPKIKARECLAPSAITTPTCYLSWVWLAGAASKCSCLLATNFEMLTIPRISPLLVTWRHRGGQEPEGSVYIDCKLRQLDCVSIDL